MNLAHTPEPHLLTFYPRDTLKVTGGKTGATALRRYVRLLDLPLLQLIIKNGKRVYFATKWQRLTNTCARNVNTWAPPSILKIEINDNHCMSTDFMYFVTNKHLSTTALSLNHDTKSLPFSQKAAIIIYISQLNPIKKNTHTHTHTQTSPFYDSFYQPTTTSPTSSVTKVDYSSPFPIKTIRMHQFSPTPFDVCYMFYHANDPNIWYTQTLLLCTFLYPWHFASLITDIIFSTLEVVQSIHFPTVTTNLTHILNSAIYAG
jgi:hypothetical protein